MPHRTEQLIGVISTHPLFSDLERDTIYGFLESSKLLYFPPKTTVVTKGGRAAHMYVVISGRLKVQNVSEDGKTLITRILEANDTFDEIPLLDGKPRAASVISVTAVELLAIERESFLQFIDTHKTIALKLIHSLCHTARSSNDFLESVVFLNLPVRLAKVLRLLCLKYGEQRLGYVELNARISQGDLASLVGASRESINKQLRSWEDSGLLKIQESGKLHIDEQIIALAEKPSS